MSTVPSLTVQPAGTLFRPAVLVSKSSLKIGPAWAAAPINDAHSDKTIFEFM